MTHRLLLVEQSATMRYVIEKHAESLGFAVDACTSYPQAVDSLDQQFQKFGTDYAGVIYGWPTTPQDDAAAFAQQLEASDHKDLPVVVMSTDMRAETRAWVAGRDKTAVLAWKEYQQLESLLKQLIDTVPADEIDVDTATSKRDNRDVHLLVVDDSATIRYSLRDLFHKQGYRVTLAATRDEAVRYASDTAYDIAILDYYLAETTGDVLCRELLASEDTGDIVCTVLTGTYSDHIIKRSLRAGAVECMFKNESSELLLSRIDAISRFVRQRRQLQREQRLLEDVLECIAGAVVLINDERRLVYVNTLAIAELGLKDRLALADLPSEKLLEEGGPQAPGEDVHAATWQLPDGNTVEVDYQHTLIDSSGYSLLRFAERTVPIADADLVVLQQSSDPETLAQNVIRQFSLLDQCKPFLLEMLTYLGLAQQQQINAVEKTQSSPMQVSLLVLDVFVKLEDLTLVPVATDDALALRVRESLFGLVARENHVTALGENRYGFLLRYAEDSQAYVLTRKVMQHCLKDMPTEAGSETQSILSCSGSLLSLTRNAAQPMNLLVQHTFKGLDLVNSREPNQAILLDVRRLLSAFPAE